MEDDIIIGAINHLASQKSGTPAYKDALEAYDKLIAIEKTKKELIDPSWFTKLIENAPVVNGAVTIIVTVVMLQFEKTDIITSAVKSFIRSR